MSTSTLTSRVSRLEAMVDSLAQKLMESKKPASRRSNKPARAFRMKSLSTPPLEGLPTDLSIGTREKVRDLVKARHAAHR